MVATPPPVLELVDVSIAADLPRTASLRQARLRLAEGELAVVRLENGYESPLAPAALGLAPLSAGTVRFEGHDWDEFDLATQFACRGRIGRVFAGWGWVSNLNVLENVVLRLLHHTPRAEREMVREADQLARRLGLERVPRGRPAFVAADELRRAEWVRAFLGEPRLILLERPLRSAGLAHLAGLLELVEGAQQRKAAVLWLTSDAREWDHPALRAATRWIMQGSELRAAGDEQP